jgi:hypothetical protein
MLNLEKLSRTEKLSMMEAIWDDLSHESAQLASPAWHAQALQEAEQSVAQNQAGFVAWDAAKKALRDAPQ